MPSLASWLAFVALATILVATPGPNRMVVVSRSLSQVARAGLVSLAGVGVGFLGWMPCAVSGFVAAGAGRIARFLQTRPRWLLVQRWIMGSVLGVLAARMAVEARR